MQREHLLEWIRADAVLASLHARAAQANGADPAHDLSHTLRVAGWTCQLLEEEAGRRLSPGEIRQCIAAGLLHDWVNLPKNHPERALASQYSAEAAGKLMAELEFPEEEIPPVCRAIRTHSYSRGELPSEPLGKALQDADRLEALGAIGIMRCAATSVPLQAQFFHPEDPFAQARPLDDRRYSVDHFFLKLLRLPEQMTTAAGRREATKRAELMLHFLRGLGEELGVPLPESSNLHSGIET